jgi:CRP-like cAMP-binding protein/Pyruvate/2-oxoacid:ferredoxin oxidoreductase delta subunit
MGAASAGNLYRVVQESNAVTGSSNVLEELHRLAFFAGIPMEELTPLVPLLTFRIFSPHQRIVTEGEEGKHLYFILEGQARVTTRDRAGRRVLLAVLEGSDFFGEGSLFTGQPRSATVEALTRCWTLQVPREDLRRHLENAPTLRAALYQAHRDRQIVTALSRMPLFSTLSREDRHELAARFHPRRFPRHSVVIRENEPDRSLFLITWGQAAVVQDHGTEEEQALATLEAGDVFGEMALLRQQPRSATVWTLTRLETLELPEPAFRDLMEERPKLRQAIEEVVTDRLRRALEIRSYPRIAQVLNRFVLGEAAVAGRLLIRERDRCPEGCRRCEQACQRRFGHSRLHLDGVVLGYVVIPVACRHCLYPECVSVCSQGALEWDEAGRLFVNEKCQGCGRCALACPYGAIEMVQVTPAPAQGLFGRLLLGLQGRETGPHKTDKPSRPEKCDLCRGYDSLACQEACPTGALKLVCAEEYFGVPPRGPTGQ